MPTEKDYAFLHDWDVVGALLMKELTKGAQSLFQKGVPPQSICKVFNNVCDKVLEEIHRLAVSMEDFDMKAVLSKYYATQLPTQLFGTHRTHIANIVVAAVYASGYDYEDSGPFLSHRDDFEDGFNLIGIKTVLGGCVDDSFFVEGIGILFKTHVDGFANLDVVENPEILILNIKPDQNSQIKDMSDELNLIDILKNPVKRGPNVVLTSQAIDKDSKEELAKRCIYFADLVSEDDLNRVAEATYAEMISYYHNYPQGIVILFYFEHLSSNKTICLLISLLFACLTYLKYIMYFKFLEKLIGTCKSFQQKIYKNEVFGIFSGCSRGMLATIVLRGNDQFNEEAKMYEAEVYVGDLIPEVRSVMKEYKLVDGGRKLYYNIIHYVRKEAKNADKDSKPIIDAFANAIQAISDKTYDNVGCNPSQKHAIAPGVGDNIVWEPPSGKEPAVR